MGGSNHRLHSRHKNNIRCAEVVLPCTELDETLSYYTNHLGFRIEAIFPADAPRTAVISGHGLRVRLKVDAKLEPGHLLLKCDEHVNERVKAPNGTLIEFVSGNPGINLPEEKQSFTLSKMAQNSAWHPGRAGMQYRDLIPNRQGGRFIASHIKIQNAGDVADYVHFHKVRFQIIYCYKGWAKLVYEDQGEPFIMRAGDCVLQPPQIRHRVLESSAGLEVIEIGCPAEHETLADHSMQLPTAIANPDRDFYGQYFLHHKSACENWQSWRLDGFEAMDLGIAGATNGLVGAYEVKEKKTTKKNLTKILLEHDEELLFIFILTGTLHLFCEPHGELILNVGDACVIPAKTKHALTQCSNNFKMLEIRLSAKFGNTSIMSKSDQG